MNDTNATTSNQEVINDVKCDFYTREGLWQLVPSCDYIKSTQQSSSQQQQVSNSNSTPVNGVNNNTNIQTTITTFSNNNTSTNDPVKLSFVSTSNIKTILDLKCEYCKNRLINQPSSSLNNNDLTHQTNSINVKTEFQCKYCQNINSINSIKNAIVNNTIEIIVFNYSKELYTYYYNGIKQPNETRSLLDKKSYKQLSITCHDVNIDSYLMNTSSLLIAAGFCKGEIHVYDAYKRDSSQFFNSNKSIDKTKATCIKWLPNSNNQFLISYASGNIYLYDISYQTQQTNQNQTPNYQIIHEGDGYTVYNNVSIIKNSKPGTNITNAAAAIGGVNINSSSSSNNNNSNTNHLNVDKVSNGVTIDHNSNNNNTNSGSINTSNPIIKWTITGYDSNNINGINEFAFSPCTQYLAIACQDGYLRVFNYKEMTLKSQMKSYFGGILCLSWSHDGKYIATGGEDDLITVFSFFENRVACRGRGHSSWINCVQFDYWAQLYNTNGENSNCYNQAQSDNDNDQESDFEDYHNKKAAAKNLTTTVTSSSEFKNRLSSANSSSSSSSTKNITVKAAATSKTVITSPSSSSSASSMQQQVTVNRRSSTNKRMSSISDYEQIFNPSKTIFYRLGSVGQDNKIALWDLTEDVLKEKLHSRSRVTSIAHSNSINQATNTFNNLNINSTTKQISESKKTNEDTSVLNNNSNSNPVTATSSNHSSSGALGFFRKNKRGSSLNVNKNSSVSSKTNQFTSNNNTTTNSLFNNKNKIDSSDTNTQQQQQLQQPPKLNRLNSNNLCPKLDEIPIIEPLICKKISQERLTALIFKEDSFIVACQDGIVSTWARPGKASNLTATSPISLSNDKLQNSTFL